MKAHELLGISPLNLRTIDDAELEKLYEDKLQELEGVEDFAEKKKALAEAFDRLLTIERREVYLRKLNKG